MLIQTTRLDLIPGTALMLEAELIGRAAVQEQLGVTVPEDWPPPLFDARAVEWALARLRESDAFGNWGFRYFVLRKGSGGAGAVAVGAGGYKGAPADGAVEVSYSVLPEFQRRGFATEAAGGLAERAFEDERVDRVIAETLPELIPSIGVLVKLGFRCVGQGSEEGAVRYQLDRPRPEMLN